MDDYESEARAYLARMVDGGWRESELATVYCGTLGFPWSVDIRANTITVKRDGSDRVYRARATDLLPSVAAQLSLF
jgi:hypothetical protein